VFMVLTVLLALFTENSEQASPGSSEKVHAPLNVIGGG
jgi:hypothetical protein